MLASLVWHSSPARAEWGVEPTQVRATGASCRLVASASDGRGGAIVVWQEGAASGGVLKAERLDANGDVGTWAHAPLTFCSIDTPRHSLGAVSDDVGGAYVWWMEYTTLYLTRLTPDGFIADGWAARGYPLGDLPSFEHRPRAKPDGQGGVYVGWVNANFHGVRMTRFEPGGLPDAGWPAGGRTLLLGPGPDHMARSFGFDPTSDGGLWVGVQTIESEVLFPPQDLQSALMLQRLGPSGAAAPGWEAGAIGLLPIGSVPIDPIESRTGLVAVASDSQGGAFIVSIDPAPVVGGTLLQPILLRVGPGGGFSPGWNPWGVALEPHVQPPGTSAFADASVFTVPAANGAVFIGQPIFPAGEIPKMLITLRSATGVEQPGQLIVVQDEVEASPRDDGGLFVAASRGSGPTPGFAGPAHVGVWQLPTGASFIESQGDSPSAYYMGVGLASTGDGGAILAWSQRLERQGVFAIRLNRDGVVTSVPPSKVSRGLIVRFERGSGVQVTGATGRVTLSLHDLTGRQVARGESPGSGDWTVPGTAGLPSGMYFAKAVMAGSEKRAKVIVIR